MYERRGHRRSSRHRQSDRDRSARRRNRSPNTTVEDIPKAAVRKSPPNAAKQVWPRDTRGQVNDGQEQRRQRIVVPSPESPQKVHVNTEVSTEYSSV